VFTVDDEIAEYGKAFVDLWGLAFNGSQPSVDVTSFIGKTLTQINGVPTLDYLQYVADSQGTLKSAGVRLNSILEGGFYQSSASNAPLSNGYEIYTFSDGTTADFSAGLPVVFNSLPYSSVADLQTLLAAGPSKREAGQDRMEHWLKLAYKKMSPIEELRRNQQLEKRLLQPRSLKILNVSLENAVVAASIVVNSVEYVVLQITTFIPPRHNRQQPNTSHRLDYLLPNCGQDSS